MSSIVEAQSSILQILSGKINDFYLAGGTALSLFYFNHRISVDLDFFTQEFNAARVRKIISDLEISAKKDIKFIGGNLANKGQAEVMIYSLEYSESQFLKIDFVRDVLSLIEPTKELNGINVLSIEDIYLRKIYAISGLYKGVDESGRTNFFGGRQEAKDLFDIYYLSHEFSGLADFVDKYCEQTFKEGLIRWFRTFKRTEMKADLADIKTDKNIEFRDIDKYLAGEISKILIKEIDLE